MKSILITLVLCLVLGQMAISAQNSIVPVDANDSLVVAQNQNEYVPVTHWSLGVKGGLNYFRIAPEPLRRLHQVHLTGGAVLEYTINPLVGLGVEYIYNPFSRSYKSSITTGEVDGNSHDLILFGAVNLSNFFAPYRNGFASKVNVYALGGVGYGAYTSRIDVHQRQTGQGPMGKVGLEIDYNFSKSLALTAEGQYRFYHRQLVSGEKTEKSNNLIVSVGLTYKFNATAEKQHARNISMREYYPRPQPIIIEKIVKDNTDETVGKLKALENENAALNAKLKQLSDAVTALSESKMKDVDADKLSSSLDNIEFEFGSDKLNVSSNPTLEKLATLLKDSKASVKLKVVGYTDYIGSEEFNEVLSVKRANSVKQFLLSKGVPVGSVSVQGLGEKNPVASNSTEEGRQKNRRVELEVNKY